MCTHALSEIDGEDGAGLERGLPVAGVAFVEPPLADDAVRLVAEEMRPEQHRERIDSGLDMSAIDLDEASRKGRKYN